MKIDPIAKDFLITAEKTNLNIFLTGNAWTWKSTTIDYYTTHTNKKFVLLWTTWTAAINIWWQTLHRFFWIWKNNQTRKLDSEKIKYICNTDTFIIDEVSMLRADLFDALDQVLRDATGINALFWWKQMIFVWDLLQLPPVLVQHKKVNWIKEETDEYREFIDMYPWRFFFNAKWYDAKKFKTINLLKIYRQDNQELINNLNLIRAGIQSQKILSIFNKRVTPTNKLDSKAIYVCSSNMIVKNINDKKLWTNKNKDVLLSASIKWDFEKEDYPIDRRINVKKDCRVMFTKNHPDQMYSNWTLWTLLEINPHSLIIQLDNWNKIELSRFTWENVVWTDSFWERIVTWYFSQFPIKVAHAITIHKSQGKTFDNVIIDTWYWCFESGMLYVALSRCTNLEGIQLVKQLKISDIRSDIDVKNFLNN